MKDRGEQQKILATSAILLIDAMVFQEVLARKDPQIDTLSSIRGKQNIKKSLEDVWSEILKKNYQPIFKIALDILQSIPASSNVNSGLKDLIEIAYDIASSPILLKHDLFGRVYHTLLLGKLVKYYATLYTSIPAARLLARLLVGLSKIDVDIPVKFENEPLRVVDFACGSGTLLSAIYKELELKHRLEAKKLNIEDFHKYLIEEGLWGFDVLKHATHLTMTTLSLHNPSPIEDSRIYALKLGVEGKEYHFGSIDFLESSYLKPAQLLGGGRVGPLKSAITEKEVEEVELPHFHICVMNPPFTRSAIGNLLFGGLPDSERVELQRYLGILLSRRGLSGIGQAGSAAIFVFVADRYLVRGGRLGLVLPRSTLSGSSWKKVREKLLSDYHIEYIITSFEGDNNWNFSENTNLSEVLIVAKKLKEEERARHTIFVNLWRKPRNEVESISIGSQLLELYNNPKLFDIYNSNASVFSIRLRGKKIGEAYSAFLDEKQFGHISFFAQAELNRVASLLRKGILYLPKEGIIPKNIPLAPLSDIIEDIGPDCGYISKTFEMDKFGTYKGFWGQRSEEVTSIGQSPNTNLKPKNVDAARKIWDKKSNLLLAYRAWLPTNRTLSIFVSEPVISSMWWTIITKDEEEAKILALWLNSTFGLLLLLSSAAEVTRGPWIEFKKGDKEENTGLWGLPVINLHKLREKQKQAFLDLYGKIANKTLEPFPEEFSNPKTKKEIDDGINEILGIKADFLDIYEMLSRDSMITGSTLK
jgi:type I restriction-modification system DNA methylase subunit